MKKFLFNYQSITKFSEAVDWHFYLLRCLPCQSTCQKLYQHELFLHPLESVTHSTDCFGNPLQYGSIMKPHKELCHVSSGVVGLNPYILPEAQPSGMFRVASALTACSARMQEFAHAIPQQGSALYRALELSKRLHQYMEYQPCSTQNSTSALQAFEQQKGVCQDFAHILIALCREQGIAIRYVNGFVPGEGETHAWTEVWDHGAWHGIDPTNNHLIDLGYIKIAHGRDAADCPVNRGIFRNARAVEQTEVRVIVEEI
ncbi:MAG: transglutaminase family protein [Bacteroidaceae bacterium]|nr:transglutaminase family protein [Bacteroidaceae bacterium]